MNPVAERSLCSTIPETTPGPGSGLIGVDEGDATIADTIGSRLHHQDMRFEPEADGEARA